MQVATGTAFGAAGAFVSLLAIPLLSWHPTTLLSADSLFALFMTLSAAGAALLAHMACHRPGRPNQDCKALPAGLVGLDELVHTAFGMRCDAAARAVRLPLTGCPAGFGARAAPQLMRQSEEAKRITAEDMDYEQITAAGLRPYDLADEFQEVRGLVPQGAPCWHAIDIQSWPASCSLHACPPAAVHAVLAHCECVLHDKLGVQEMRVAMEWRRWEQADKWHWNPRKRQRWAQGLWRAQHVRPGPCLRSS